MAEKEVRSLLFNIPKTELHLHLEGIASVSTIWNLMKQHSISFPGISSEKDLEDRFQISSLDDFIDLFINVIQESFHEDHDIELLIGDLQNYLNQNNIVYAEIFFAPSKFLLNGFSFEKMMAILDEGAKKIEREDNRQVRYIIDVSRTSGVKNAQKNLELTLEYKTPRIIGIGLGGAEVKGPAKQFEKVFRQATETDLHLVAHAGEAVGPESIWDALNLLHAERIGHGTSAIFDPKLMDYLRDRAIPLEICPTSNLFTKKYVKKLEDHPIRKFYDHGMIVTVNTDDPSIFGKDLIGEYEALLDKNIFTLSEVFTLIKNNIYSTFLSKEEKDRIWQSAEKVIFTATP